MAAGWHTAYDASAWFKSGVEAAIAFAFFSFGIFVSMSLLHTCSTLAQNCTKSHIGAHFAFFVLQQNLEQRCH